MRSLCVIYSLSCEEKCVSDFTRKRVVLIWLRICEEKKEERKRELSERVRAFASITLRHDVTFMRAVTMMHEQSIVLSYNL